ncbi:hypothetical protein [Pedobacter cryoconitis]|uniref:DUF8188 domain-containing protein n=1 Tax=Pedobacter cryoconitis TaxID=188932 RepID=A0A327RYQ2_9SPHI|nr:hypothetical protein [Pedobacter cryoconitis]RAJ20904.1 hypothetical protein LY11_05106 [Pedobacter cryoconitis]
MNKILYGLFCVGCVLLIYKYSYAHKNDSDRYLDSYKLGIKPIRVLVPKGILSSNIDNDYINYRNYKKGISLIGFKGLSGHIYSYDFLDSASKKNFRIYLFDVPYSKTTNLRSLLPEKPLIVYANQDELKMEGYGVKENPIPVFSFQGVAEPVHITSQAPEAIDGYESLEPTNAEYLHNVETYLKYIMPGDEFKRRFYGI